MKAGTTAAPDGNGDDGTTTVGGRRALDSARMAELRSLYLIAGTDGAKIDATRARLRARAERDGGAAALEVFEPGEGRGAPDHEALLAAIPAMSLTESRRYLLADGVERWRDRQLEAVAAALGELPPDLTVVLIARAKAPAKLVKAVKAAKGEIHEFEAPKARDMPRLLVADAKRLGFRLDPAAARMLVDRMGANPVAPAQRAGAPRALGGRGGRGLRRRPRRDDRRHLRGGRLGALRRAARTRPGRRAADRRAADLQGENVTGLIYGLASRLRKACAAAAKLEEGMPPKQVESGLGMHPYAAKQLVAPPAGRRARRPAGGDDRPGRPRGLVPRGRRLRRRAGADAHRRSAASDPARRSGVLRHVRSYSSPALVRALARRFARLGTSCGRRCSCASRPSARPCRSRDELAVLGLDRAASPPSTALSSRRK